MVRTTRNFPTKMLRRANRIGILLGKFPPRCKLRFISEILYKICSPRQWNFEKWAFRSIKWGFSLGIWAYFLIPISICLIAIPITRISSPETSAGFMHALGLILDSCLRTYFLWVPRIHPSMDFTLAFCDFFDGASCFCWL
eukprot:UN24008